MQGVLNMVALVQKKLNSLNWDLAQKLGLILLNVSIIITISHLAFNTKIMDNSSIILSYLIIGLLTLLTMKMNNETINELLK